MTIVSANISFMRIFAVSLDRGRQTTVGLSKRQFSVPSLAISSEVLEVRAILLHSII